MSLTFQVSGALLGAGILHATTPPGIRSTLGSPSLSADVTTAQGFGVEFLITFNFVFVIFSAVDSQRRDSAPATVVVGFALLACHLWAVRLSASNYMVQPSRFLYEIIDTVRTYKLFCLEMLLYLRVQMELD